MRWLLGSAVILLFLAYVQAQTAPWDGMSASGMWQRRGPFPPMLENLLTQEAKEKLEQIRNAQDLSREEYRARMDKVLDTIPPTALAKLPLPPAFERLPTAAYDQLKALHASQLTWSQRTKRVREILQAVPFEQRKAAFKNAWFPRMPPPAFESVLAPTIYGQLMAVHQNTNLSVPEKKAQVDRIMQQVPPDQLARLPLPPLMRQLPEETQSRIRSIMHNYRTPWDERHKKVHDFVRKLPVEERRLMRPPLPPFVEILPGDVRARLLAIHENDDLEPRERLMRFREIIDSLPADLRAQIRQQESG